MQFLVLTDQVIHLLRGFDGKDDDDGGCARKWTERRSGYGLGELELDLVMVIWILFVRWGARGVGVAETVALEERDEESCCPT